MRTVLPRRPWPLAADRVGTIPKGALRRVRLHHVGCAPAQCAAPIPPYRRPLHTRNSTQLPPTGRTQTGDASDMTWSRTIVALALTALLAGCAATAEQQAKRDSDRCAARGLEPGSKAHDDCIMQSERSRDARLQARHRELVERPAALPPGR